MTRNDLQGRAIRLYQLAYGLAADLDGYPRHVALEAAELLGRLDDILTPVCGHCGDCPPRGHTCPACGKQARP